MLGLHIDHKTRERVAQQIGEHLLGFEDFDPQDESNIEQSAIKTAPPVLAETFEVWLLSLSAEIREAINEVFGDN